MKPNYKPPQQPKYSNGPAISLGHAEKRSVSTGYSQPPVNNVWSGTSRAHYPSTGQNSSTSWLESTRAAPYEYEATFAQRDPVRDPYGTPQAQNTYYAPRAATPPSNFYDQESRYGDYRPDTLPPVAPNTFPHFGHQPIRPFYEPPRMYPNSNYYTPQNTNRSNFPQQHRSYSGGTNSSQMRGRNQKRPFQQNRGFNNGKRTSGDLKRPFNSDDKKKYGGVSGKPASFNKPNGSSPSKEIKTANNNASNQSTEKRSERTILKPIDDLTSYFAKSKTMGETRRRTARFKLYRVFSTQGLNYTTTTEQVGTYAKRGQLNMKVVLKTFFPQTFNAEISGNMEYEDASYDCATNFMLKLNKFGLLPVECIANFYDKKPHYNHSLFEKAKQCFKLLIEETNKHEFTSDFKEGKAESAEQSELLQACIESVAERIRNNDLPPIQKKDVEKPVETDAEGTGDEKPVEETSADSALTTEAVESAEVEMANAETEPTDATTVADDGESEAKRAKLETEEQNPLNDLDCTDEA